jgi:hypothetical protein
MVRDIESSHLHIASCYEDIADSNSEMMKHPLITATQSSDESLAADEQTRSEQAKQQDKGLVCQAFLLGSAFGFLFQVMSLATWCVILNIWGRNRTFSGTLSLVSSWTLVLLSLVNVVISICFWLAVYHTWTKSGYLHLLRKKLDQDASTPAGLGRPSCYE